MRIIGSCDSREMQWAINHIGKKSEKAHFTAPGYTRSIRPARTLKHPDIRAIVGAKPICSSVLT